MADRKTGRTRHLPLILLAGVGLAVAGWVATALLVGFFVGMGRDLGQHAIGGKSTPTLTSVATAPPSATPTISFAYSLARTSTTVVTLGATATQAPSPVTLLPPATPTPVATATPVRATLSVYQLPTTCALSGCRFDYPNNVVVPIPSSLDGQLSAYGAAGMVVVGPTGWTGEGRVGVQGNAYVSLHPAGAANAPGPHIEVVGAGTGAALDDALPYFEQARVDGQRQGLLMPTPITGVAETLISPDLAAYRLPDTLDGLGVDGVAYFTDQAPGTVFKQMEVTLPLTQRGLSTAILDAFIAQEIRSSPDEVVIRPAPTMAPLQVCTVWSHEFNATVTFSGPGAAAICPQFAKSVQPGLVVYLRKSGPITLHTETGMVGGQDPLVCRGTLLSMGYVVRDTGGHVVGSYYCQYLAEAIREGFSVSAVPVVSTPAGGTREP